MQLLQPFEQEHHFGLQKYYPYMTCNTKLDTIKWKS